MRPASRSPRRHALALSLAGIACLAQCLGGLLPEPVVCLRGGRAAQGELFSRSCSCRHGDHDVTLPDGPAARRIGTGCVDVPLVSPALLAAPRFVPSALGRRFEPAPSPAGMPALPPAAAMPSARRHEGRRSPPAEFPSPLPGLRC